MCVCAFLAIIEERESREENITGDRGEELQHSGEVSFTRIDLSVSLLCLNDGVFSSPGALSLIPPRVLRPQDINDAERSTSRRGSGSGNGGVDVNISQAPDGSFKRKLSRVQRVCIERRR